LEEGGGAGGLGREVVLGVLRGHGGCLIGISGVTQLVEMG
jgi:hypothetical protein